MIAKEKAKKAHDDLFLHTARTFESYCRLAGEERLANKVRLEKVERVLHRMPEKAFYAFDRLRRHLLVPVPGLL